MLNEFFEMLDSDEMEEEMVQVLLSIKNSLRQNKKEDTFYTIQDGWKKIKTRIKKKYENSDENIKNNR